MEILKLKKISKKFYRYYVENETNVQKILSYLNRNRKKPFYALKNITFNVKKGENLGIIGDNGSGKSTLLRIIAGIYSSNSGNIEMDGKPIYLSKEGFGLISKLTMKENIFLIGSLLGLNENKINQLLDKIIKLSGLKDYLNTKVYQFSSGMESRLSFSISINFIKYINPKILLADEIVENSLDINFRKIAIDELTNQIKGKNTSLILVSHELEYIKKYCKKAMWLEKGKIKMIGPSSQVINSYLKKN